MAGRNLTSEDARHLLHKQGVPVEEIDRQLGGAHPYDDKLGIKAKNRERHARANNYGAKQTRSDIIGRTFHSGFECWCAEQLWFLQQAGFLSNLTFQKRVTLLGKFTLIPDFRYTLDGRTVYHEAKGYEDKRWAMQVKLWELFGPTDYLLTRQTKRPPNLAKPAPLTPKTNTAVRQIVVRELIRGHGPMTTLQTVAAMLEGEE